MKLSRVLAAVSLALPALLGGEALAKSPAQEALEEVQNGAPPPDVVQNRFFLKSERFEVAPVLGYVPNNPMVKRYTGGVLVAYHFSEEFAVGGQLLYAPDLGTADLKPLVDTLVYIANSGDATGDFQQPLDKMVLGATFSANWAPVYGKINLIGAKVINFDLYGSAGLGMLTVKHYTATPGDSGEPGDLQVSPTDTEVKVPVNLAIGSDFFITQTLALKLEVRSYLYVAEEPDYTPGTDEVLDKRLYNVLITSLGFSMYFPEMSPRIDKF